MEPATRSWLYVPLMDTTFTRAQGHLVRDETIDVLATDYKTDLSPFKTLKRGEVPISDDRELDLAATQNIYLPVFLIFNERNPLRI